MTPFSLRPASGDDVDFLAAMLYEAAFWRPHPAPRVPREEALRSAALRPYLEGWGREGDSGLVARAGETGLGAAWYRLFSAAAPGYGFVDEITPEVTLAVGAAWRRRGVGAALLAALVAQARLDGFAAVSLSVELDNPARALYERCGFERVALTGGAETMLLRW